MNNESASHSHPDENTFETYNDGVLGPNFVLALVCALLFPALVWFGVSAVFCIQSICCSTISEGDCCFLPQQPDWDRYDNSYDSSYDSSYNNSFDVRKLRRNTWTASCLAAVSLLTSSMVGLVYAVGYSLNNSTDYVGPMRIMNWTYTEEIKKRSINNKSKNNDMKYKHVVQTDMILEWGYDWACPDYQDKVCISTLPRCSRHICTRDEEGDECSPQEIESAYRRTTECANQLFHRNQQHSYYSPYDPQVGPSQDVNWPSLKAVGRCDNCEVSTSEPYNPKTIKNLRTAYIPGVIQSLLLTIGTIVMIRRRRADLLRKRDNWSRVINEQDNNALREHKESELNVPEASPSDSIVPTVDS